MGKFEKCKLNRHTHRKHWKHRQQRRGKLLRSKERHRKACWWAVRNVKIVTKLRQMRVHWTGISWASTKASGSPASIAEPSSRPRETSISESWQLQNPQKPQKANWKILTIQKNRDTSLGQNLPLSNIQQMLYLVLLSPHTVCILKHFFIHPVMTLKEKTSWAMFQAQIDGAWGCEVRLWPVWCWVHCPGKPQKAQTFQTWTGKIEISPPMSPTFQPHRYDGSATCASPRSRTRATWGGTSWRSTKAPLTTVTSARHSLGTTEHCADTFSQNTRESGDKNIFCHSSNAFFSPPFSPSSSSSPD